MYRQGKLPNVSVYIHEKLVPQIWPGITKLFRARKSLVSDIPAGERKIANLFFTVYDCAAILLTFSFFLIVPGFFR
jgi:hypothetical protein